jgi:hypothetical protein
MKPRSFVSNPTPEHRRILNGLLDGFRLLGPLESTVWLADYFDGYAIEMMRSGHAHAAKNVPELVEELRALVDKYKALER